MGCIQGTCDPSCDENCFCIIRKANIRSFCVVTRSLCVVTRFFCVVTHSCVVIRAKTRGRIVNDVDDVGAAHPELRTAHPERIGQGRSRPLTPNHMLLAGHDDDAILLPGVF